MSNTNGKSQAESQSQVNAQAQNQGKPDPNSQPVRWTPLKEELAPNRLPKQVQVGKLEGVLPAEVQWIAEGRVPRGALCVVAGEPGSCKSLLAVEWAARVSNGQDPRDGVLIAHAADMPAPILRARLDAAGATIERLAVATLGWPQPGDDCSLAELERRVIALAFVYQLGRDAFLIVIDNLEAWAASLDETPSRARI